MNSIVQQSANTSNVKRDANGETIARMQRGILRLALAYHGQSPPLDRKLKEFGTLVRSGRGQTDRQQLIDEIVDTIVTLDLKQEPKANPSNAFECDQLGHFIDCLALPETLRPAFENTQRTLAQARDRAEALALIKDAASTLSEHLMQSPDSCGDAVAIRMLLLELVERLPLSKMLLDELPPLRLTIEKADRVEVFVRCIDSITELVNGLRMELQAEIDRLGQYLKTTAERLAEFDQYVNRSGVMQGEIASDAMQLSDTINSEMRTLREDAEAAEDIEAVRGLIDFRLENISGGLDSFVAAQNARAEESNEALKTMAAKLQNLEQQTENLRGDLEEQHERILLDPLTGIMNRTGYNEASSKEFARWKRYGGSLSLAVIDLDLFKRINDAYGHAAGDRVLATVASKLRERIRDSDILCRYGGEEFVLILPGTNSEDASALLDKLRAHIATCPFRYKETPVPVTLSCGIAEFSDDDNLEDVFERADKAMYQAKSSGRDRVFVSDDDGTNVVPVSASG